MLYCFSYTKADTTFQTNIDKNEETDEFTSEQVMHAEMHVLGPHISENVFCSQKSYNKK